MRVGRSHGVPVREIAVRVSSIENAVWNVRGRRPRSSQSDAVVREV